MTFERAGPHRRSRSERIELGGDRGHDARRREFIDHATASLVQGSTELIGGDIGIESRKVHVVSVACLLQSGKAPDHNDHDDYVREVNETASTGGCLCRGVRYFVGSKLRDVWMCHCEDCRRTTGNHMAATGCQTNDLSIEDDGSLRWFSRQPGVEYGFCSRCGSSVFWRASDRPEHVSICVGTLDRSDLPAGGVLFREEAAPHCSPHPDVPTYARDRDTAEWET